MQIKNKSNLTNLILILYKEHMYNAWFKKKNRQTFLLKLSEFKPDLWLTAFIYKVSEINLHLSLKLRLTRKYLKSLTFCQWPSQTLERWLDWLLFIIWLNFKQTHSSVVRLNNLNTSNRLIQKYLILPVKEYAWNTCHILNPL